MSRYPTRRSLFRRVAASDWIVGCLLVAALYAACAIAEMICWATGVPNF